MIPLINSILKRKVAASNGGLISHNLTANGKKLWKATPILSLGSSNKLIVSGCSLGSQAYTNCLPSKMLIILRELRPKLLRCT